MSANRTSPASSEVQIDDLRYEDAFQQLEEIVVALESGEHSLDAAMDLFERGQLLARHCSRLLDQAELKVQQLLGETITKFEA